ARAHRGVPIRLRFAGGLVERDADVVDAVVDEYVRIRNAAHRAVLVVEYRGLPGHAVPIVVTPLALHRREVGRLRVDELRALDGVLGADPGARIHEVRDRPRLARGVVLVVAESDVHD